MRTIRRRATIVVTTILVAFLGGCSESTQLHSLPSGSKVFVNDALIGFTPVTYSTKNADIGRDYQVRVEHPGYESAQGKLVKQACTGRTVGAVFTLGILALFRSSTCFVPVQDFVLAELPSDAGMPSTEARLQRLEKLRQQGVLSEEDLARYRAAIEHP